MSDAITNLVDILGEVTDLVTNSSVLMCAFVGSLFVVGAKVFKKIKKAARA